MVSVLDLIILSLLRERYLFTCSPMTIIMWPFWFVAVLDVIHFAGWNVSVFEQELNLNQPDFPGVINAAVIEKNMTLRLLVLFSFCVAEARLCTMSKLVQLI